MIIVIDDKILVEPLKKEEKKNPKLAKLIILESTQKELGKGQPLKGRVTHVGDGTKDIPMKVKIGDIIHFSEHNDTFITIEDKTYLMIRQAEVLVIERKAK